MSTLRQIAIPLLAASLAAAVIVGLLIALGGTGWADGFRAAQPAAFAETAARGEAGPPPGGILNAVDAFLKVVLFMGIPGLIANRLLRRSRRRPRRSG